MTIIWHLEFSKISLCFTHCPWQEATSSWTAYPEGVEYSRNLSYPRTSATLEKRLIAGYLIWYPTRRSFCQWIDLLLWGDRMQRCGLPPAISMAAPLCIHCIECIDKLANVEAAVALLVISNNERNSSQFDIIFSRCKVHDGVKHPLKHPLMLLFQTKTHVRITQP